MAETRMERRCPLWAKIVLGLSLAVNLGIVGLVGGIALRGEPLGGKGPGMGYAMPYVLALPHEDRRAVFGAVRDNRDLPGRGARRAAYQDMVTLLKAGTFDDVAVAAVLERQSEGVAQVQKVARAVWLDRVAAMSGDERTVYADRLAEVVSRGGRHKPGKGD
ncbi:periplasmic heavy metal sensor [uncultured Tateyamaria sp.]|uniref:periplasmic heavy metal sensor n=1 Tax=uncultured Tateyamaria sp. TaxID=455651 RepID=UPI002619D457|nr:periplasmic heavy metal sensor [uncultured Tateyamaria sp.]